MAQYLNMDGVNVLWGKTKDMFAPKSHSHSYLPLAGGEVGKTVFTGGGAGSASISYANAAMTIGTVNRSGTAGEYYPGIAFNHMYTYNSGSSYRNHAHAWIGLKLHSTPAAELSYLVFATNGDSTTGASPVERMSIAPDGNITATKNITAAAFYQSSDERLKTFYDPIEVDLEKLKNLRKNYFKFNDKDKLEIGVSAQEIQEIYPELVSTNDEGYLSVAYDKLSIIALKAVDKLNDENNELKNRLNNLESILKEKGIL